MRSKGPKGASGPSVLFEEFSVCDGGDDDGGDDDVLQHLQVRQILPIQPVR